MTLNCNCYSSANITAFKLMNRAREHKHVWKDFVGNHNEGQHFEEPHVFEFSKKKNKKIINLNNNSS